MTASLQRRVSNDADGFGPTTSSQAATPLRIVIADDHTLFRVGLKSLLAMQPSVIVVGETDRTRNLEPLVVETRCDLLLLDLQMGQSSLPDIPKLAAHVKVIVVTASEHPEDGGAAMRAGARAVVFKRFAVESLLEAIQAVASGQIWMPMELRSAHPVDRSAADGTPLTDRERAIVRLVALGMRNAEVAQKLFITEETVKTHLNRVFQKLGVRDRVQLAICAHRLGIVSTDETLP